MSGKLSTDTLGLLLLIFTQFAVLRRLVRGQVPRPGTVSLSLSHVRPSQSDISTFRSHPRKVLSSQREGIHVNQANKNSAKFKIKDQYRKSVPRNRTAKADILKLDN